MTDRQNRSLNSSAASHGGDIYRNRVNLDFSVSLNPLGMPKEIIQALREAVPGWSAYPDPYCGELRACLSEWLGVRGDDVTFGNGAAELIYDLVFTLKPQKALIFAPTFSEYERALRAQGCEIAVFTSGREDHCMDVPSFIKAIDNDTDLVFLCNPNNPTGESLRAEDVREIERACHQRQALLCVDETFVELTGNPDELSVIYDCGFNPRLFVLRAFTKTFALAGLRLGYAVCSDNALLRQMELIRQPWSVSAPALCAGTAAVKKVPPAYLDEARSLIASERGRMSGELSRRGFTVIPSAANFLLFCSPYINLYDKCLERGILLRSCSNFSGLGSGYFRIGLKTEIENDVFVSVLDDILA